MNRITELKNLMGTRVNYIIQLCFYELSKKQLEMEFKIQIYTVTLNLANIHPKISLQSCI